MHIVGWYQSRGNYGADGLIVGDALKQYAFTQQMVWEALGQSSATFVDSGIQSEYNDFKNETNNKIAKMGQRVSFDASTVTIKSGETTTVTDTNDVLKDYASIDITENGIHIVHNKGENFMTFSVDDNCTVENYRISDDKFKGWGMIKEGTQDKRTTVYISFETDVQDQLYSLDYNDPVTLSISLAIEAKGKLELKKLDSNGTLVSGAVFTVSNDSGFSKDVTVTDGRIEIDDLKPGVYSLKEKEAPYRLSTGP